MASNGRPVALMFADANFLAHVSRVFEIGKVLRDDYGYDVRVAGDGAYLKLIQDEGFPTDWVYTVNRDTTLELARRASIMNPLWWQRTCMKSIESDIEVIKRHQPDIVVGDMHWSLKASARECGVPYAAIVNGAWTNYLDYEIQALDDHFLTSIFGERMATRMMPGLKRRLMSLWSFPYRIWKARNGHTDINVGSISDIVCGDVTLLADVPEFCPTKDLPENVHYVGPLLWHPPMGNPEWLETLDPRRPTVYVSMGSTGKKSFFELAAEAFADSEYQVVMTTGDISLKLPAVPDNFFITNFAPGLAIMEKSDCVINHGGNGTIYQALTAGIPIVGIPTHVDQQLQLQLCERLGVGRKLREKTIDARTIRVAVDELVGQKSYRLNAERLSRVLANYNGAATGARLIDDYLRKQDPKSETFKAAS